MDKNKLVLSEFIYHVWPILMDVVEELFLDKFLFQILYSKLFLILGILWTFSFLHYLIHGNHSNTSCEEYSSYIEIFFRIIDSFNLLRGFFMFIIFVCKKNVLVKVKSAFNLVTKNETDGGMVELTELQTMSP